MRDSRKKNKIAMWFNTELFCINGKPLKFHIEGCSNTEFYRIARIVEAYGGGLSEPSADTILFSDAEWSIGDCQYYNLKYLHDSITANQALELAKYKLPSLPYQRHHHDKENANYVTHAKNSEEHKSFTKIKQEYPDPCSADSHDLDSTVEELSTAARTKPFIFTKKRKNDNVEDLEEEKKDKKIRSLSPIHNDSKRSPEMLDRKEETSNYNRRSIKEESESKKKRKQSYTDEEKKKIMQYLIDNDGISRAGGMKIWAEMIQDLKITHRTPVALHDYYRRTLQYCLKDYTDDARLHEERDKQCGVYTDEDNRKIMRYVIDKNLISRVREKAVWRKLKREVGILHGSIESLKHHFSANLMEKYEEYTKDADACKEFKKIVNERKLENSSSFKRRRVYHRWTKEENQIIINWLIDNDEIHRARTETFWEDAAEELKLKHNPTAPALFSHFCRNLLLQHEDYTSDPKALKKFKALQIKEEK